MDCDAGSDAIDAVIDVREKYRLKAHDNISSAQERQKKYFDARHDSHHVHVHVHAMNVIMQYALLLSLEHIRMCMCMCIFLFGSTSVLDRRSF